MVAKSFDGAEDAAAAAATSAPLQASVEPAVRIVDSDSRTARFILDDGIFGAQNDGNACFKMTVTKL